MKDKESDYKVTTTGHIKITIPVVVKWKIVHDGNRPILKIEIPLLKIEIP